MFEEIPRHLKSPNDNISEILMGPCLSECSKYRRLTGFFKPSVLKRWQPALSYILKNDVTLEIMVGGALSNFKIFNRLKSLETDSEREYEINKYTNQVLLAAAGPLEGPKSAEKIHRLLRYLFAKNKIKFKVVFSKSEEDLRLEHSKIGYFEMDNQLILFEGSMNESDSAYLGQGEHLTVFKSSNHNDKEDIDHWKNILDELWEGPAETEFYKVISPDNDLLKKIKDANDIFDEKNALDILDEIIRDWEDEKKGVTPAKLRPYQIEAMGLWFQNSHRGILEHATGSGKTFTAMNILKEMFDKEECKCVVGVPTQMLAEQWTEELKKFFKNTHINANIVECWDSSKIWMRSAKNELENRESRILEGVKELSIFVVVNRSLMGKFHQEFIQDDFFDLTNTLFIGDECHNYNGPLHAGAFPDYSFRLGLSATPVIDIENPREGEKAQLDFFGGIIHEYTISKALNDGWLSPYTYKVYPCEMNEDEFDEWFEDYKKSGWDGDQESLSPAKQAAWGRMSAILGSLESKFRKFEELIKNDNDKAYSLVFCGQGGSDEDDNRDLYKTSDILKKNDWDSSSIASKLNGRTQTKKERNKIMENFEKNIIDTIAAIRVLDEGIDVPAIKKAYILASSKNRRQFVQRRGRVLRKSKNKKTSEIIDFAVQPPKSIQSEASKKIALSELKRIEEMAFDCLNKSEVDIFINNYRNENGL